MANPERRKHVALALTLAVSHQAQLVQGVIDYSTEHGKWLFSANPATAGGFAETISMPMHGLQGWSGDGVIAIITSDDEARKARNLGIPVVNIAATLRDTGVPRVMVDHKEIGRLAARHLLECGLRRFAYLGLQDAWFSRLRGEGFMECVTAAGCPCEVCETARRTDPNEPWHVGLEEIEGFLRGLQPPVGVMAVHDYRARLLLQACQRVGLSVPNDVAVISSDNDEIVCEFCEPTLTSVSRNGREVGYQTAALLDRLMAGEAPPKEDVLVPPDGVVKRQSTDLIVIPDFYVATAVRYIHSHLEEPFGVERFMKLMPISRRRFERVFKKHLGETPYEYLCRARVARAKELLVGPRKMTVNEVARRCGFTDAQRFRIQFARFEGVTPTAYRRAHRGD